MEQPVSSGVPFRNNLFHIKAISHYRPANFAMIPPDFLATINSLDKCIFLVCRTCRDPGYGRHGHPTITPFCDWHIPCCNRDTMDRFSTLETGRNQLRGTAMKDAEKAALGAEGVR